MSAESQTATDGDETRNRIETRDDRLPSNDRTDDGDTGDRSIGRRGG